MLDIGADVNIPNKDNVTPLYIAAHQGHTAVVRVLTRIGAALDVSDVDGWTAGQAALQQGHTTTAQKLESYSRRRKCASCGVASSDVPLTGGSGGENGGEKGGPTGTSTGGAEKADVVKLKICQACKNIAYCSRECQVQDFKRHKPECKVWRSERTST